MAVVRLIAHVAGSRNRDHSDYLSIVIGVFVKVNDGKKVRGHAGLIAGPDIKRLGWPVFVMVEVFVLVFSVSGKCGSGQSQSEENQSAYRGRGIGSVIQAITISSEEKSIGVA
jgi:hypothetical protein